MNNPYNLDHTQRGITPVKNFGRGINFAMSKERRKAKQKRHLDNMAQRRENSAGRK